ncbi:MAG: hypothetical protein FWF49_02430 [Oscillospiraceae bacterium]|nr:hypothetical protein [Oscillospiraceae bacterium]
MFAAVVQKSRIKIGAQLLAILAAGAAFLIFPQALAAGVSRGLSICSTVILPSLFPFLVLAGFLVRSGLAAALGRSLSRPTRFLFGVPGCAATAIVLGLVGGYPAGGAAVRELLDNGNITVSAARRLMRFCVNAGPAFVISAVGAGLMGSVRMGAVLFAAQALASLLLGIGLRVIDGAVDKEKTAKSDARKRDSMLPSAVQSSAPLLEVPSPANDETKTVAAPRRSPPLTAAFVESVSGAVRTLLMMCGFVVLFAALLALCDALDISRVIPLLPNLLEVSCGSVEAAGLGLWAPLVLALTLGFAGLSMHCQLAALLSGYRVMGSGFFAARAAHAALAALLTLLLLHVVPMPLPAMTAATQPAAVIPFSTSAAASVALLLMCGMLLLLTSGRPQASMRIDIKGKKK